MPALQFVGLAVYHGGCIGLAVGLGQAGFALGPALAVLGVAGTIAVAVAALVSQAPHHPALPGGAADWWDGLGLLLRACRAEISASLPTESNALRGDRLRNAEVAWARVATLEARAWQNAGPALVGSRTLQHGVATGIAVGLWQGALAAAGVQAVGTAFITASVLVPLITETSRQLLALAEATPPEQVADAQRAAHRYGLLFVVACSLRGVG